MARLRSLMKIKVNPLAQELNSWCDVQQTGISTTAT
jgi:hypothetical protein